MSDNRFSRRYFFYGSLLAGAVPAGGFGSTPSLPKLGYKSPNEKLNLAAIGLGIRGPENLKYLSATENVVALCDPDEQRSAQGFKTYGEKATKYKDFRKLFDAEAKNIDAVMIATPDHLHAPIALRAMQLGKHVYCEKPLTRTVSECRMLADAATKYGVATQMGNQGFNHEAIKTACEILWSGEIGEVREVHAWTGGIYGGQPNIPATGPEKQEVPGTLDWDLWLGPASPRDFNRTMTNQWRAFQDFGTGGSLGDWLVHNAGPAHLALQLDRAAPTSVECVKVEGQNQWIWPLAAHLVFEFPARGAFPAVKVHLYQNMRGDDFKLPEGMAATDPLFPRNNNLAEKGRPVSQSGDGTLLLSQQVGLPPAAGAAPGGRGPGGPGGPPRMPQGNRPAPAPGARVPAPGNGCVFVGSKGHMATTTRGEGVWLLPAARWADYKLPTQSLQRGINHHQDWVRSCKGGAPGVSNFPFAAKYIEWLALGAIALRVPNQKLLWDAKAMRFTNSPEANKYIKPYLRKGWELKV